MWFDSELIDGIGFSNHPNAPELIYGNGFFPFTEPVAVMEGDRVELRLAAKMVQDDYVWRWDTNFFAGHDAPRSKVSYKQSTFFGVPLSTAQLPKLSQ